MLFHILLCYITLSYFSSIMINVQRVSHRGVEVTCPPPQYSQNCKKVGKMVDYAARKLVSVMPVTFLSVTVVGPSGQMVKMPPLPMERISAHLCRYRSLLFHTNNFSFTVFLQVSIPSHARKVFLAFLLFVTITLSFIQHAFLLPFLIFFQDDSTYDLSSSPADLCVI